MDNEATPPIWTEESAVSVMLFSGPLKPGGAQEVVFPGDDYRWK